MSYISTNWVRQLRGIPPVKKSVLMMIAFHANTKDGELCYPSVSLLADECGLSQGSIRKSTAWLAKHGYISKRAIYQGNDDVKPGGQSFNEYRVLVTKDATNFMTHDFDSNSKIRRNKADKFTRKNRVKTAVFERDGYYCRKCGANKDLTLDHIVAVANGGEDTVENMQVLCRSCNSTKGIK